MKHFNNSTSSSSRHSFSQRIASGCASVCMNHIIKNLPILEQDTSVTLQGEYPL
jgi:hypothetical protein